MNQIRLDFADRVAELQKASYHENTSKKQKLIDKNNLDAAINASRIPLLKIMKLTIEDLHRDVQSLITAKLSLSDSSKKIRYDRKHFLSLVKSKILEAYRKDNSIDILKYAKETNITI
jgi:hypothetical protein